MSFRGGLRFWGRHLLFLNITLFALAWLLYGSLELRSYAPDYWARTQDIGLEHPARFNTTPGIENVLLPALAAATAELSRRVGLEFGERTFIVFTAIPYALFIYGVTRHVSRRQNGGRVMAVGAAAALYSSGMIPYMTAWGGYVDGMSYLLMLPVFIWPESLAIYVAAFALQCLNHYLGALALLLFAFVWHSVRALDATSHRAYWLRTFAPRLILSVVILAAFVAYWQVNYPAAAGVRQAVAAEKWREPAALLQEVVGPFPFTLLSALKLSLVPVVALMATPAPYWRRRVLTIGGPFAAAAALTFIFVDVTRVATMLMMPALLLALHEAGRRSPLAPAHRRQVRRLVIVTGVLGLLMPNYYVNNGEILVPKSNAISAAIDWAAGK